MLDHPRSRQDYVGGPSRKVRESLTSYLVPFSQSTSPTAPLSPPSSLPATSPPARSVAIPLRAPSSTAYPLTPASSIGFNAGTPSLASTSVSSHAPSLETPALHAASDNAAVVPLITSLFPSHAAHVVPAAHMLEIVTPPDHVLRGFVLDSDALGRAAFVHLPPTHASAPLRPERLTPHFSAVLRPHDPAQAHPSAHDPAPASGGALDIRDSITALLDLAADCLDAAHLVLILDRDEREPERLDDLLHALMYVGGQPVRPGAAIGEWQWDARQWMLVSIEL